MHLLTYKRFQNIFMYLLLSIHSSVLYTADYWPYGHGDYGKLNNQVYITIESPAPFLTMKYSEQTINCGDSLHEEENIINFTHYKVPYCLKVKRTPNLTSSCIVFMNRNSREKEITVAVNDFDTLTIGNLKDNQISIQKKTINGLEQVARFTFPPSK